MRKMKKFAALAMVATLAAATFAGCGKKDSGSDNTGSDVWSIGSIGPITGDAAVYGNAVKDGAQIAVDEINAAGGIYD